MDSRSYTVKEIDELRRACEDRWLYGTSMPKGGAYFSRTYREDEKVKCVEEIVRTHMLAGHTAQDIYDADRKPAPQEEIAHLNP